MSSNADWVWKQIQDNDVKFVKLWFTDILGFLKSFSVPVEELDKAMEEGIGFDGSSIKGFTRIDESDMVAVPDPSTFTILPWRPKERAVARMFCDILNPDRSPYEGDPRQVLKRNLRKAREMGFTFYVGPEAEYFYFRSPNEPEPLDQGGYFDLIPRDEAVDLRRETVLALEEMGIYVEYSHHEVAPSQHEIDLRYTDALTMADTLMTYRLTVKEIAYMNGVYATFMPKPLFGQNGSGMHVHQSLFKGEENAFFDPNGEFHLSQLGRHYIAGILKYVPEFTAVTNQWVNSYKRLVPGYEAPVYVSWAQRNRSNLVRIPMYKPGKEEATRIELRSPDPACNPYLAFSVMLAAGLRGIEEQLECPPPTELDLFQLSQAERDALGITTLPGSLMEAIALCEKSSVVRDALGEHVFREFIANKQIEWNRYRMHVTDFELKEYLPLL
jgi:glutamine synthetase